MDIIDIPASTSTYSQGRGGKPIEWIVIHYTGSAGTARNNGTYFSGGDRNASAHYFLDGSDVVRSVGDGDTAWAVGNFDMNQRSVSIEVCSDGEDFTAAETAQLTELTRSLMDAHGIDADHVIRHHDVADHVTTGGTVSPHKDCPAPYVSGDPSGEKWSLLHQRITEGITDETTTTKGNEKMECIITDLQQTGVCVYFDGARIHDLTDPDDINVLNAIHNACFGSDIPCFKIDGEGAPWTSRLYQSLYSGAPVAIVPGLDDFASRTPKEV